MTNVEQNSEDIKQEDIKQEEVKKEEVKKEEIKQEEIKQEEIKEENINNIEDKNLNNDEEIKNSNEEQTNSNKKETTQENTTNEIPQNKSPLENNPKSENETSTEPKNSEQNITSSNQNNTENTTNNITEQNNNKINEIPNDTKIPEELLKSKLKENDVDKYLVKIDEEKELENLMDQNFGGEESNDEDDEEETFPFRIIGNVQKKGETFGFYNYRYLEIDTVKGLLKRYMSSKEYPKNPIEEIPIQKLKVLKKVKKLPGQEFYDFEVSFMMNKGNKEVEKFHYYRVRHSECRNKWFEVLLALWKHLVKNEPLPKINKNKLILIDDQVGIVQDIKQQKTTNKNKINEKSGKICLRNFKLLSILGVGGFGTVFKVQHIMTEKIYAMKVMNKNYLIHKKYLHYVVGEFEILKLLAGFPFVLDLHYCFQSANYLYMVIDYCPNGDFTDLKYINNIKLFFAEVILAFEHIHKHNVVYRDTKPENILLDIEGHIKICDFNLSKAGITKEKKALSFCGSPMYLSPEMLDPKGVDERCDIYGIGLMMYELITGIPAYKAPNIDKLYEKIKNNDINFDIPILNENIDAKDLIKKILVGDPDERISLEDMKKHPYFKDISFLKVFKKEYGPIITTKKDKSEIDEKQKIFTKNILETKTDEEIKKEEFEKEKKDEEKFKEQQSKLDANKEYSFLDGKISVREMKKDQKRIMKNYVREFFYVKKEDDKQTEDFQLTVNGTLKIEGL